MNNLESNIRERHTHDGEVDQAQIDAVYSPYSHLIVEAPAGYGKTRTMVSKMAYLIAIGEVPYPKNILALTFSINAAFKTRKEVRENLPSLLANSPMLARQAGNMVVATNYHGLGRRILARYGSLISPELVHIDALKGIGADDNRVQNSLNNWGIALSSTEAGTLIQLGERVRGCATKEDRLETVDYISANYHSYLEIVKEKFLPKGYIPFNSILLFVTQLFDEQPQILDFYQGYFPVIVVDEFQDTNILQWLLLNTLAGKQRKPQDRLLLFGDPHQRIYDFIGALDGIMDEAKDRYSMQEIALYTNHRFKNVSPLLDFDRNVRIVANDLQAIPFDTASVTVTAASDQASEAKQIIKHIESLLRSDPGCSIAVLTRAGKDNQNTRVIIEHLNAEAPHNFSYFFALYSDEDPEYLDFHRQCLTKVNEYLEENQSFRSLHAKIMESMKTSSPSETQDSLLVLLKVFFSHTLKEFRFLTFEEKVNLLTETLSNNALKQHLVYVDTPQIVLSTIHGSKGLEWDYVILPDMEKNSFPTYLGVCKVCKFQNSCAVDWDHADKDFLHLLKQEVNLFYVGGTRARKATFFTYSTRGLNYRGLPRNNNLSCLLTMNGITTITV